MTGNMIVLFVFLAALAVAALHGPRAGFVWVYLPALLLLATFPRVQLKYVTDATVPVAALYGIFLALPISSGGEFFKLRVNLVDLLILALSVSKVITSMVTEHAYTGVNIAVDQFILELLPYFLARKVFESGQWRRSALNVILGCLAVIFFFSLIETRLFPYFFTQLKNVIGCKTGPIPGTYHRFGLFRAKVSFQHPIDLGNCSILIAALIALLASTTTVGMKHLHVKFGIAAAMICLFTSISFTSYMGFMATAAAFLLLYKLKWTRNLLVPGVLLAILVGFEITFALLHAKFPATANRQALHDSFRIRAIIVQHAWPLVTKAGWFGWGKTYDPSLLNLDSLDNTYLLSTMTQGFVYLTLLLLLAVAIALRGTIAFLRCRTQAQAFPVAVTIATLLGIMVAMYTVWSGAIYATIWRVMLGFGMTLIDLMLATMPRPVTAPQTRRMGPSQARPMFGQGVML